MNNFDDREKRFERKFVNDQEVESKISAKRNINTCDVFIF
jgi:hypothetical protein